MSVKARTATSMRLWDISSERTTYSAPGVPGAKRPISTGGCSTVDSRPK